MGCFTHFCSLFDNLRYIWRVFTVFMLLSTCLESFLFFWLWIMQSSLYGFGAVRILKEWFSSLNGQSVWLKKWVNQSQIFWTNPTHLPERSGVLGLLRSGSVLSKAPIKPRVFGSLQNKSAAVSLPALLPNYRSDFIFVLFNSAAIFFCTACICLDWTECMCEKQSALTVLRFARRVFGFVRSCAAVFSQSISLPAATTRSHCLCSESRNYSLLFSSWQFW